MAMGSNRQPSNMAQRGSQGTKGHLAAVARVPVGVGQRLAYCGQYTCTAVVTKNVACSRNTRRGSAPSIQSFLASAVLTMYPPRHDEPVTVAGCRWPILEHVAGCGKRIHSPPIVAHA